LRDNTSLKHFLLPYYVDAGSPADPNHAREKRSGIPNVRIGWRRRVWCRAVAPHGRHELVIYVENAGDFTVPLDAVESVHSGKVIFNCAKLDRRLRQAIGHANDEAGFLTSL
jgi:hypothetical protein